MGGVGPKLGYASVDWSPSLKKSFEAAGEDLKECNENGTRIE